MLKLMHTPIEIPEGALYRFPIRTLRQEPQRSGLAPAAVLELLIGDLVGQDADAIVVPCGGQVDFAVRRAAGPRIGAALRRTVAARPYSVFAPGDAVITSGFALAARHVVHCLPPIYHAEPTTAESTLRACYRACLALARTAQLESIAFPALATGVRAFPPKEAAAVAISTIAEELRGHGAPLSVRLVVTDSPMLDVHLEAAGAHFQRAAAGPGPRD